MPRIKEFVATNTLRTDDKGFSAFETLGRRVGGQYDQAGNDIRDIGRAQAASINMIGRWPFNIIDLEQREAARAGQTGGQVGPPRRHPTSVWSETGGVVQQNGRPGQTNVKFGGGGGGHGGGRGYSGGSDEPRMPNLAALNQMSEGAGALGHLLSRGNGSSTPSDRDGFSSQALRERDRQDQLNYASYQKYRSDLNDYNKALDKYAADKPFDPVGTGPYGAPTTGDLRRDMVSSGDASITDFGVGGVYPDPPATTSLWGSITGGLSSLFSGSDSGPTAEADTSDYSPSY